MKKILSIVLVSMLALALSIGSFAGENDAPVARPNDDWNNPTDKVVIELPKYPDYPVYRTMGENDAP